MKIRPGRKISNWPLIKALHPYVGVLSRRLEWLTHQVNLTRAVNMAAATAEHVLRRKRLAAAPLAVKIDISPLCNLRCTVCVHANPAANPDLLEQRFHGKQKMSVEQFGRIIRQIHRKTSAVSLYYLGDPLIHPHLDQICRIAADARLNSHINTNFSFPLSDERLESIVRSGLTHLTACVDGLTQKNYQRTRVGGKIERVLWNIERACRIRRRLRQKYPRIEVQYIKYKHNVHELGEARRRFQKLGVDQFSSFWGDLHNYTDLDPSKFTVHGPRDRKSLPGCHWPYFSAVIKYNGDVIPCCFYRTGTQYTARGDAHVLGNVFQTPLDEIWNSPAYQSIRKLACDPALAHTDEAYKESFCYGCERLYHTDLKRHKLSGQNHAFETIYEINPKGIPVRRQTPAPGKPQKPEAA